MTTYALVATPQPTNSPPRMKIDVTTSGSPTVSAVNVVRTDAVGSTAPVRTNDGGPFQLTTSGATQIGTLYDVEMPYGVGVTYSLVESPTTVTAPQTVSSTVPWLVHFGVPDWSQPVDFRIGSFEEETRSVRAGVFRPMGRKNPLVISDGRRKGRESSLIVSTDTLDEADALDVLLDDAGVLLLNVPTGLGLGVETAYVFVQDVSIKRPSDIGSDPHRDFVMPYLVVDRPAGGSQAQYTWADVLARYSTWAELMAANATWADVMAPTT